MSSFLIVLFFFSLCDSLSIILVVPSFVIDNNVYIFTIIQHFAGAGSSCFGVWLVASGG